MEQLISQKINLIGINKQIYYLLKINLMLDFHFLHKQTHKTNKILLMIKLQLYKIIKHCKNFLIYFPNIDQINFSLEESHTVE